LNTLLLLITKSNLVKEIKMSEGIEREEIGIKNDEGKLLAGLVIQDFGLALLQVSGVGTYGADKYAPKNWLLVEGGERRYFDALMRHLLLAETEENDPETGISHLSHVAWNILAVVELIERRKKEEIPQRSEEVVK